MTAAGRAAVEAAKADGRWERAYAAPSDVGVPADLAAAIPRGARGAGDVRHAVEDQPVRPHAPADDVKKAETRQRKIEGFVAMLTRPEAPSRQKATP